MIDFAINWVNELQNSKDGAWYKGDPIISQKINGAMKVITALKASDRVKFAYPEKLIDLCLSAQNNRHACENFNIIYVLKQTQIISLRSKKDYMKKREFAWHIILFNIKKKIRVNNKDKQTLIFLSVWIYVIPDNAWLEKVLKTQLRYKIYRLDYVSISYLNSRDIGHNVEDKNES